MVELEASQSCEHALDKQSLVRVQQHPADEQDPNQKELREATQIFEGEMRGAGTKDQGEKLGALSFALLLLDTRNDAVAPLPEVDLQRQIANYWLSASHKHFR